MYLIRVVRKWCVLTTSVLSLTEITTDFNIAWAANIVPEKKVYYGNGNVAAIDICVLRREKP